MANIHRGEFTVELDKPRRVRIDMNDMAEVEDAFGGSPFYDILQRPTVKQLRMVLWRGLLHDDPAITEHEVGAMMTSQNLAEIGEMMRKVFGTDEAKEGGDHAAPKKDVAPQVAPAPIT